MKKKKYKSSFELQVSAAFYTTQEDEPRSKVFRHCVNCNKKIYFRTQCYYIPDPARAINHKMEYVCSILCGEVIQANRK
jgi:predicted nucleic acid-binding Zn ribbon protein